MFENFLFAAVLLLIAIALAWHCQKSWRRVSRTEMEAADRKFHLRKRWRRMAVAVIIALIALVIPLSALVGNILVAEAYLLGLAVALLAMFLMALLDLLASRAYFAREREKFDGVRDELEAELKQLRSQAEGNGRGKPPE